MTTRLIVGHEHDLGHGLVVRRSLPTDTQSAIGPFVFLDHVGPVVMDATEGRKADVRPHPHIGLSTVSYLLGGAMRHCDNLGFDQVIHSGDINWMTAGRGIVHSERFDADDAFGGNGLELLQTWVALPDESEAISPSFSHVAKSDIPAEEAGGQRVRVLIGEAYGLESPVPTYSPTFYVHAELSAHTRLELPNHYSQRGAYVVRGRVTDESSGVAYGPRQLLVFSAGGTPVLRAEENALVMLLGGEPVGTRYLWWNLVASSKERIRAAAEDWKAGRFKLPMNDDQEYIPLPDTPI